MWVNGEFGHTAFVSYQPGVAAVDLAIPQPASIWNISGTKTLGPSIDPVTKLMADELTLDAPAANTLSIYIDLEGTAVVGADLILRPGSSKTISGAAKTTLSAIAGNAGDVLEIQALYR